MYRIEEYKSQYGGRLIRFLEKCLPESGRTLELDGRHKMYQNAEEYFDNFWCLFDKEELIGTVAIRNLGGDHGTLCCELKSLYLLERYHKKGLGRLLLDTAISAARQKGYARMYLDTLSTGRRAVALYEKAGFVRTQRYNDNRIADVFMVLELGAAGHRASGGNAGAQE